MVEQRTRTTRTTPQLRTRYRADTLDDLPDDRLRQPTSVRRYQPVMTTVSPERAAAARAATTHFVRRTTRTSRGPQPLPRSQQTPVALQEDNLADDEPSVALVPRVGQRVRQVPTAQTEDIPIRHASPLPRRRRHPFTMLVTAGLILGVAWFLGTSGLSWWDAHIADPALYGPLHGSVATGVFGGGDSATQPTKLMAMNNDGQVEIIEMMANDPTHTRILVGPNLVETGFPDPGQAEVALQVVQQDSREEVQVTVWSDSYALPFMDRVHQTYLLVSDGKGNLKVEAEKD